MNLVFFPGCLDENILYVYRVRVSDTWLSECQREQKDGIARGGMNV